MSKLSQTTCQLLEVILHVETATEQHYHDSQEARRIITNAFKNAAMISGIPSRRPDPAGDFEGDDKVFSAGASLKDWAIENVVIPWEVDELKAAFDNVVDHYWSAIGSDVVMTAIEPKLGKNGGAVDDWLNIREEFQASVDTWVKKRDRHPIRYHHIRMQPVGKGKLKCFHEFCVDTLRQEISTLEQAAFVLYVAYLKRRLSDPTCEHVIDSIKELRREITTFRDKATDLMKLQEPEIRERIKLIPFDERERYLCITGLQHLMNAVEERVREHEDEGDGQYDNESDQGGRSYIRIDTTASQVIYIGDDRIPFTGTTTQWEIIRTLIQNIDDFSTTDTLLKESGAASPGAIRVAINTIRRYLKGTGVTIETGSRGEGYRLRLIISKC